MAAAFMKVAPLALRWQGPRIARDVGRKGFVCGRCKRQEQQRGFHQAPVRKANNDDSTNGKEGDKSMATSSDMLSEEKRDLDFAIYEEQFKEQRAKFDALSAGKQKAYLEKLKEDLPDDMKKEVEDQSFKMTKEAEMSAEEEARISALMSQDVARAIGRVPKYKPPKKVVRRGKTLNFWDDEEEEERDDPETDRYEGDDLTELGHMELEHHRELREYARLAAWEMPLLSKLAQPFKPPDTTQMLRFRYTTYLGEEHPAANKIVLQFNPLDLPNLTEIQRNKLIKLVGVRYDPETQIVKMSCEMFETQAQNKRYLGDLVEILMAEAKDDTDTFEDVPLDFRHHKYKKQPEFPQEWVMTSEKRKQLAEGHRAAKRIEEQRTAVDSFVEGAKIHEMAMAAMPVKSSSKSSQVEQQQGGKKGKPKQRMLR